MAYAPTVDGDEDDKDRFYDSLQEMVDKTPRHDATMILGDFNAKVGREVYIFGSAIGAHSMHEECNENGIRLASFANANRMIVGGTIFPHKSIHKETWNSPDNETKNQIDHVFI